MMIDQRLLVESLIIGRLELTEILLVNNSQYPWLILVPRKANIIELSDLEPNEQITLIKEINLASCVLQKLVAFDKINIGMLGNIVRQLHVHIVARTKTDPSWPYSVWPTKGARQIYQIDEQERFINLIKKQFTKLTDEFIERK